MHLMPLHDSMEPLMGRGFHCSTTNRCGGCPIPWTLSPSWYAARSLDPEHTRHQRVEHMKKLFLLPLLCTLTTSAQTTYDIAVSTFGFSPDSLTVIEGDSVRVTFFELDHTFRQVTKQTWLADSSTISGMELGPAQVVGESYTFALLAADTFYYVCGFHVEIQNDEKGFIIVQAATGLTDHAQGSAPVLSPNPANAIVDLFLPMEKGPVFIAVHDAQGRLILHERLIVPQLNVRHLPAGAYTVTCMQENDVIMARERLIVAH